MRFPGNSRCSVLILSGGLALALCAGAQPSSAEPRPRIGLVLNGGGALGCAHIGVLEWLEENRIPVDKLAGTSMGGLVGGAYATGMSPSQLRELVSDIPWDAVLGGRVRYPDLSYRRKQDTLVYPNRLEFGYREGFKIPSGLNSGHGIGLILDQIALPYSELSHFDELPIPFRCAAVEMISGKIKVFESGLLTEALRSTMSIQGLFDPVRKDGEVFTDGGLLNNLPVDIAKQMGADITIAVWLNPGPVDPKSLDDLLGVVGRSVSIVVSANELRNLQLADLVIAVDLKGFTGTDYGRCLEIAGKGRQAAEARAAVLKRFALEEPAWREHLAQRESRKRQATPAPQFVQVTGTSPGLTKGLERTFRQFAGKPFDSQPLEEELNHVAGSGRFASAGYHLTRNDDAQGLGIRVAEKRHGPPFIRVGAVIDGTDFTNVRFTLGSRITFLDVGGLGAEWRTDVAVGATYALVTEYYRPFRPEGAWFVAPRTYARDDLFDLYRGDQRVAEYRISRLGAGADFGYTFNRYAEFRAGYEYRFVKSRIRVGDPQQLPGVEGGFHYPAIRFNYEGEDNPVVPRRGARFESRFGYAGDAPGGTDFPDSEVRIQWYRPVSRPASILLGAAGGSTFGSRNPSLPPYWLGGPFRLSAYKMNELPGWQYYHFTAGYLHEVFRLPPLVGGKAFVAAMYELGKVWGRPEYPRLPMSGSASLVVDTAIGPAFIGAAYGDRGRHNWYFGLGRIF